MKKLIFVILIGFITIFKASASYLPSTLVEVEKSDTILPGILEAGIGVQFGYQKYTINGSSTEFAISKILVPVYVKYGIVEAFEISAILPYGFFKDTEKQTNYNNGFGQARIDTKFHVVSGDFFNGAIIFLTDFPAGDSRNGFAKGIDVGSVIAGSFSFSPFAFHINLGYKLIGPFVDAYNDSWKYADQILYGAALEYSISDISIFSELTGSVFNKRKINDRELDNTDGTTLDILVGAGYYKEECAVRCGVDFALGNATFTDHNWKLIFQLSHFFNTK